MSRQQPGSLQPAKLGPGGVIGRIKQAAPKVATGRITLHRLRECLEMNFGDACRRKTPGLAPAGRRKLLPQLLVPPQPRNRIRDRARGDRIEQQRRRPGHFRNGRRVGGGDRASGCHGLDQRDAEALEAGRKHQHAGVATQIGKLADRYISEMVDPGSDPVLLGPGLDRTSVRHRMAGENEIDAQAPVAFEQTQRLQQGVVILVLPEIGGKKDEVVWNRARRRTRAG